MVLITALGSWGKPVPCGLKAMSPTPRSEERRERQTLKGGVYGANYRVGQLGETGPPRPYPLYHVMREREREKPVPRGHIPYIT
jgi:hypothetical protein